MDTSPESIAAAKRLTVFFGKKYQGMTLGQVCEAMEGDLPRGLLWIYWLSNVNAINGPQPREDRLALHNACRLLAKVYEAEINRGIELFEAMKPEAVKPPAKAKPEGWSPQKYHRRKKPKAASEPEVYEV